MNQKEVTVGKHILDILTTGMYKDPCIIAREFVQNSVDALDRAIDSELYNDREDLPEICVSVDEDEQTFRVEDQGIGVQQERAWENLTSIAASQKNRSKELGFRGIGRLAGLAYCRKLIIETSAVNEKVKTILEWDAQKLRTLIHDEKCTLNAQEIIQQVTTHTTHMEDLDQHYYRVTLEDVTDDALLNRDKIKVYLSEVAPVPFLPSFIFKNKIVKAFDEIGAELREYRIFVNNDQLFKPYRSRVYEKNSNGQEKKVAEVIDVKVEHFSVSDEKISALCWYAITSPLQLIKFCNPLGIRLRKGNIQVGDRFTLQPLFYDTRFHKYFLGELHIISNRFVPNGQRDYFEDTPGFRELEKQVTAFTSKLEKLCRNSSQISSNIKKVADHSKEERDFKQKEKGAKFIDAEEKKQAETQLNKKKEEAEDAEEKIQSLLEKDEIEHRDVLVKLAEKRREDLTIRQAEDEQTQQPDNGTTSKKGKRYRTSHLTGLRKREQKLVSDIYRVIKQTLPADVAENLIVKIQEELKLNGKDQDS